MKRYCCLFLVLVLGGILGCALLLSGPKVHETVLGHWSARAPASGLAVSPDGNHVAVVERRGSGQVVVVDGVAWKKRYATVAGVCFSPDSRRVGCVAGDRARQFAVLDGVEGQRYGQIEGGLHFSADGRHIAYKAQRGGHWFMVVDGVEGPVYENVSDFRFSPQGGRHAYLGHRGQDEHRLVIDGVEDGQAFDSLGPPCFSPDGSRLACATAKTSQGNAVWRVLLRDAAGEEDSYAAGAGYAFVFGDSLRFSPDGRRLAFIAARGEGLERQLMVLDGAESKVYREVSRVYGFSPDSKHFAFVGDGRVVRDGAEGQGQGRVWKLLFSPDSRHLAVAGEQNHRPAVLLDGAAVAGSADRVDPRTCLLFSPDSRRLAFTTKQSVVVDGGECKRYVNVAGRSLCFSPDGEHLAYVASPKRGKYVVVKDGDEGKEYDQILANSLVFSPDSKHVVCKARQGDKSMLVTDGSTARTYGGFPEGAQWVFDGPDALHAVAFRDGKLLRVEVRFSRR